MKQEVKESKLYQAFKLLNLPPEVVAEMLGYGQSNLYRLFKSNKKHFAFAILGLCQHLQNKEAQKKCLEHIKENGK